MKKKVDIPKDISWLTASTTDDRRIKFLVVDNMVVGVIDGSLWHVYHESCGSVVHWMKSDQCQQDMYERLALHEIHGFKFIKKEQKPKWGFIFGCK